MKSISGKETPINFLLLLLIPSLFALGQALMESGWELNGIDILLHIYNGGIIGNIILSIIFNETFAGDFSMLTFILLAIKYILVFLYVRFFLKKSKYITYGITSALGIWLIAFGYFYLAMSMGI